MEQTKTKKALIMSVLSVFLCIAMLIGMTFAWFTDTASTGVNKIQAGKLDVALEMKDASDNWVTAEGKTLDFVKAAGHESEAILWEPGCTYELPKLRVVNKGNLALKYKVEITGIAGDKKLAEIIDWKYNDTAITNSENMVVCKDVELSSGEGTPFTISAHMQESAGNEYQGLSIDGIAITVYATQMQYESDSNGNTYDEDAEYPISSQAGLNNALADSTKKNIVVGVGKYTIDSGTEFKDGVTLSGVGIGKTILKPDAKNYTVGGKNVTIKDVTIDGRVTSSFDNNGVVVLDDKQTLDGVEVIGGGTNTYGHSIKVGNSATIKNSVTSGAFRGLQAYELNGTLLIENTTITPQCYCLNIDGGTGKLVVNNSILKGWTSYTDSIESGTFTNCRFEKNTTPITYGYNCVRGYTNTTFVNCDFGEEFWFGACNKSVTVTFKNCRYNGVLITSENVNTILEPDDNDNTTVVVK